MLKRTAKAYHYTKNHKIEVLTFFLFFIGILLPTYALIITLYSGVSSSPEKHEFNLVSEKPSPNQSHTAKLYRGMGLSEMTGSCNQILIVKPHKLKQVVRYDVATVGCNVGLDFYWVNPQLLQVEFKLENLKNDNKEKFYIKNLDETKEVKLIYKIR